MSEIVFIPGAGASERAGAPLMKDFWKRARKLNRERQPLENDADFSRVISAYTQLQRINFKSGLDLKNIEELFGVFEMARYLGSLGNMDLAELEKLSNSMRLFISKTLEHSVLLKKAEKGAPTTLGDYGDFVNLLEKLDKPYGRCSVITFNYDVALDYAVARAKRWPDYGFGDVPKNTQSRLLLKIHGSLNWGRCHNDKCARIVPIPMGALVDSLERMPHSKYDALPECFPAGVTYLLTQQSCPQCGSGLEIVPVIVPPTFDKNLYRDALRDVWLRAASELSGAETVCVCGYSLPETDNFFKYLFALGTIGDHPFEKFMVHDPDEDVGRRFKELLSHQSQGTDVFGFNNLEFQRAIKDVYPGLART